MWKIRKIWLFSGLLLLGLVGSQILPRVISDYRLFSEVVSFFTMAGLSFIMIHVGYEFELEKSRIRSYGWDYIVAMTTAGFPWIIATLYFVFILLPPETWGSWQAWEETLLAGRFAAPTASGVLFSMLAAAGLSATWMFRKIRVLVIFDDLDTVLLMIPLKILMIGLAWQLGVVVVIMVVMLWVAWRWLHKVRIPVSWPWVMTYAALIAGVSEAIYWSTKLIDYRVPIHLEVLLPAFVLGCIMKRPAGHDPHADDARVGHQEGPESPGEQKVATAVSAAFMVLVGLSMPAFVGSTGAGAASAAGAVAGAAKAVGEAAVTKTGILGNSVTAAQPVLDWGKLILHVVVLTVLINLGKLFPALCYRREAHWKERLAIAVGMCPRGEVGAGIILLSLEYGIGGPIVTVAVLSLALNLILTPVFVVAVKSLVAGAEAAKNRIVPAS